MALAGYVTIRAVSLVVLAIWASHHHLSLLTILAKRYDAVHYVAIAHSYTTKDLAFFPLFPMTIRALLFLPVSAPVIALVVAWIGSLFAAAGIFKVGQFVGGARVGVIAAILWGALPHAVVESMAYTEGLFTAFAAWSLYFVLRERWVVAGVLGFFGCLTRPSGIALIAALGIAAILAVVRTRRWQPLIAPMLAGTGWLAYILWVAQRLGRLDGWFWVQRTYWYSTFDGGRSNLTETKRVLLGHLNAAELYEVTGAVFVAALLLVLSASARQPKPLLVYSAALFVVTIGSNTGPNKARLMIPAFALLLPVATALARARTRDTVAVLTTFAGASAWFGGYLALIWPRSP